MENDVGPAPHKRAGLVGGWGKEGRVEFQIGEMWVSVPESLERLGPGVLSVQGGRSS